MIYGEPLNLGGGASAEGIPSGGTAGQVLKKASATDYDVRWEDQSSYTLPVATDSALGGVQPAAKTAAMTQSVGVDGNGALWTAAGGNVRLLGKRTELPDGADLNGYTTPGCYCSTSSENNFSNYPAGNTAFILDVEDATGSGRQAPTAWSYGRQVLHALHEHSIWYRDFETDDSGTLTWGEWYDISVSSPYTENSWTGTQAEYDALSTYDSGTTYYIVEASS